MDWLKSTYSSVGNCVETAFDDDAILVRHSRYENPALVFSPEEWVAFVKGVKAGEFDG